MIANDIQCRAYCRKCQKWKDVDLVKLAEYKGADYNLWGRLTHCRMTDGCEGPAIFFHSGRGCLQPMMDYD